MRKILFALILSLIASHADAATYYVQKVSGTFRYATGTWPIATDSACSDNSLDLCLLDLDGGGHTVIVYPGTYTGEDLLSGGKRIATGGTNTHVRGPIIGDGANYVSGDVIIDGATTGANHLITVGHTGWTFSNMIIQGQTATDQYCFYSEVPVTGNDLIIRNCFNGILTLDAGTFNRIKVRDTRGNYPAAMLGNFTCNYCIWEGATSATLGYIRPIGIATHNFNNNVFTGFRHQVIDPEGGAAMTVNVTNSVFAGNTMIAGLRLIYPQSAGTWTFTNNILGDNAVSKDTFLYDAGGATVNYTGNSTAYSPSWVSTRRTGKTFMVVDDGENYSYFNSLATLADAYGYKVTFALNYGNSGAVNWSTLGAHVSNGHEVACHARSNTQLDTLNAFTATKEASTITLAIIRTDQDDSSTWSGTLTLTGESPIDLASAGYDSLKEVTAYLASHGVTIGQASGQVSYTVAANYEAKSLTLAAGVIDISSGDTLLFDETSLFVVELLEAKAWLENQMNTVGGQTGWTAKSFAWPGGHGTANARTYALETAEFQQVRGTNDGSYYLQNIDLGNVGAVDYQTSFGTSSADITKELSGYLDSLGQLGAVGGFYSHGYVEAEAIAIFGVLAAHTVQIDTFSNVMDWVRANDDHVTSGVSYKCSDETDSCFAESADYRLRSGSPAINAGVVVTGLHDVAGCTDFAGNPCFKGAAPDIGAYENQRMGGLFQQFNIFNVFAPHRRLH